MSFLDDLDKIDDSELYPVLVEKVQNFCSSYDLIKSDDCSLIRLSRCDNIESEVDKLTLSENGKRIVAEIFQVHQKAIFNATINKIAAGCIGSQLIAFDWNVSMVVSNSYNRHLMQPLVRITFSLINNAQNDPETLSFELTQAELTEFIAKLEVARRELVNGTQS